ncbi:hypothetical protein Tco_0962780, partial [Tanacetum coccineum]
FLDKQVEGMSKHKEIYVTPSHTKKVFANMKRQGKEFSGRDTPLFPTMMVQAQQEMGEGSKQKTRKSKKQNTEVPQLSGSTDDASDENVPIHSNDPLLNESSKDKGLGAQEDASKQGRKDDEIDQDAEVTLVDETQGRYDDNLMFDTSVLDNEQDMAEKEVDMAEKDVSIVDPVTTAGEVVTTANVVVSTAEVTTTDKDKGKTKMVEPAKPLKKKDQIMFDKEVAQKLQAQLDAELEEEKLARQREENGNIAELDDVQAMMDADYELAAKLQAEEQGEL